MERLKARNISDLLSIQAKVQPEAIAIFRSEGAVSFAQLESLTWKMSSFLVARGIDKGSVICVAIEDEITLLLSLLALTRIGATYISLPKHLPDSQQHNLLSSIDICVTDNAVKDGYNFSRIVVDLSLLTNYNPTIDFTIRDNQPAAPCCIAYGSGSTGKPKQIPFSHRAFYEDLKLTMESFQVRPGDRLASLSGLGFLSPQTLYLFTLLSGASVVLFPRANTNIFDIVQKWNITILNASVPHMESLMQNMADTELGGLNQLKVLSIGYSTVTDTLRERIVNTVCKNLYIRYGTNECGAVSVTAPSQACSTAGSVGFPLTGVRIEIVDKNHKEVAANQIGIIRIKSPATIEGYLLDSEANRRAFYDGWFYPGDLGRFADDGQLIHCGRADDMMIFDGINIYPIEIEQVIFMHLAVADVVVFSISHQKYQDVPVCAVSLRGSSAVSEKELSDFSRQKLGHKSPVRFFILDKIPRTDQGKLIPTQLRIIINSRLNPGE